MSGPLVGIRVVDLTIAVLGPVATQILGDLGAEVIKIEAPEGDMMRSIGPMRHPDMAAYFLNINRNKKSVVLDLKRPAAREALLRLAATADVLVHNMRPGAAGGTASAMRLSPPIRALSMPRRAVVAPTSAWRPRRVRRRDPGRKRVRSAEQGGARRRAALRADGHLRQDFRLCARRRSAWRSMRREKTGRGQEIHVPMVDTMAAFNLVDHLWHGVFGEPEKGLGYPRMLTPHRRPYPTNDGHICLLATTDRQWRNLFGVDCPNSPTTRGSRPEQRTEISTNSTTRHRADAPAHAPPNGASGSTRSTCRTAWSTT